VTKKGAAETDAVDLMRDGDMQNDSASRHVVRLHR
jgi:hypothetical protein